MIKLLKEFLFGKDELDDNLKSILKNKKITNEEKCDKLIEEYTKYFSNKFLSDINVVTYEFYFEEFVKNKIKEERTYNKYFKYEFENLLFCHIATLSLTINKLLNKGLNKDNVINKIFVNDAINLYNNNFKPGFDGTQFYTDIKYRKNISIVIINFFKKHFEKAFDLYKEKMGGPFPEF